MFRFFKRDIVVYTFTLVFIDFILEQNHGITNLNLVYGFHVFPLDIYIYIYMMMPKKSPVSHTVPTRSTPDLPNTEKDLTESTGMVSTKDPPKVKSEESSNHVREYEL